MRDADCFCFGTLIQRNEQSAAVLKRLLSNFGGEHIVLDINLRKNCFDDASIVYSIEACNILKLNEDEISEVSRVYSLKADTMSNFAESLMKKSGIEYIVVTLGDKGALAYSREAKPVYVPAYTVDVIDSCGSGDAFTAAFIDRILRGRGTAEACLYGSALGAMVAAKSGATDPVSPEELRDFIRSRNPDRIDGRFRELMLSSYDFFE
jgi:fructokinase